MLETLRMQQRVQHSLVDVELRTGRAFQFRAQHERSTNREEDVRGIVCEDVPARLDGPGLALIRTNNIEVRIESAFEVGAFGEAKIHFRFS